MRYNQSPPYIYLPPPTYTNGSNRAEFEAKVAKEVEVIKAQRLPQLDYELTEEYEKDR